MVPIAVPNVFSTPGMCAATIVIDYAAIQSSLSVIVALLWYPYADFHIRFLLRSLIQVPPSLTHYPLHLRETKAFSPLVLSAMQPYRDAYQHIEPVGLIFQGEKIIWVKSSITVSIFNWMHPNGPHKSGSLNENNFIWTRIIDWKCSKNSPNVQDFVDFLLSFYVT